MISSASPILAFERVWSRLMCGLNESVQRITAEDFVRKVPAPSSVQHRFILLFSPGGDKRLAV